MNNPVNVFPDEVVRTPVALQAAHANINPKWPRGQSVTLRFDESPLVPR
jgi:hypothetical protein